MPGFRSSRRRLQVITIAGMSLASILSVVGALQLAYAVSEFNDWLSTDNMAHAEAHIVQAGLKVREADIGTIYEITAKYDVSWNGTLFRSERVALSPIPTFDREFAEKRRDDLEAARKNDEAVACYLNPAEPEQAILYRDFPFQTAGNSGLMGLAMLPLGLWLGQRVWSRQRRIWQVAALQSRLPDQPWCWDPDRFEGRGLVQRRWIPIVALNIVCNVPLGFFYVALIQGMATQSRTMWWLLPPAIAIGGSLLLLLMFTVWQVARHGEPRLNVSPAPLMLGDDLKCMLRFEPDNEFKRPIAVWLEVPEELAAADGFQAESMKHQMVTIENSIARWTIPSPWRVENRRAEFNVSNYHIAKWQIHVADQSWLLGMHLIYDIAVFHCPEEHDANSVTNSAAG